MENKFSRDFLLSQELLEPNEEYIKVLRGTDIEFIAPHIGIRKVLDENGRFQLDIVIDSETTQKEVVDSFGNILAIRHALIEIQGNDFNDYFVNLLSQFTNSTYEYFSAGKKSVRKLSKKPSMLDLTKDVNFDALVFLLASNNNKNDPQLKKLSKLSYFQLVDSFVRTNEARMSNRDIFQDGMKELNKRGLDWSIAEYPINKSQMREKIRYIRESRSLNGINKQTSASRTRMMGFYMLFVKSGDWDRAGELLNTFQKLEYEKYKPRLDARLHEMISYSSNYFPDLEKIEDETRALNKVKKVRKN